MPFFFNFPASSARPEKLCDFLLAATLNHVQVRLDCTSRKKILRQQRSGVAKTRVRVTQRVRVRVRVGVTVGVRERMRVRVRVTVKKAYCH